MYNILSNSTEQILVIRIEGYTNSQDINTLLPYLKNRIKYQKKIRILLILQNTTGIEVFCILKLIPFFFKYGKHIERKAVLTDEIWIHKWVHRFSSLFKSKIEPFLLTEQEKAWSWIRN